MSTFVCDDCGVKENTALSRFWVRNIAGYGLKGRALCSECDPEISGWHGMFPRVQYDPARDSDRVSYVDGRWAGEHPSDDRVDQRGVR